MCDVYGRKDGRTPVVTRLDCSCLGHHYILLIIYMLVVAYHAMPCYAVFILSLLYYCSGWYNHVKGMMEQKTSQVGFSSVRIFRPAMIYPGNTNSPALLGRLNESLNWLLPAVYNSVGTTLIAEAMVYGMQQQMRTGAVVAGEGDTASSDSDSGSGSSSRVCIIEGGGAIRESAQASVKEHT